MFCPVSIKMSDWMPTNWWETRCAFGSSNLPFGVSAPKESYVNDGWDDLDGDLELFLAIEGLLTGERKSYWEHERLDWDLLGNLYLFFSINLFFAITPCS
jgi:hypothetical protein